MTIIRRDDPTYERRTGTPMRNFKGGEEWKGKDWKDGDTEVMIFFGVEIPIMICRDDDELEFPLVSCRSDRALLVL